MKIDVPYIDQTVIAPTGCESVSACMLVQYLGIRMSSETFINTYLDRKPMHLTDGKLYGPHPNDAFPGDPFSKDGYGCYAPVMVRALKRALPEQYEAINETGSSLEDLCRRYLDHGMPVLLWATIDMEPSELGSFYYLDGSGERYQWVGHEHCLLLVGYEEDQYWFNDPWNNHGVCTYPKETVEKRHAELGMQAVGIIRKNRT
ncbi:MAG: hypothetical protein EOM64_03175 [Erysipelotrichia bacterium]|nr:hypothetical protein [Erysipelotrichia bacterium]